MAGYQRRDEKEFTFEGKVEHTSEKAYLVEFTLGGRYWVPKSQVLRMEEPDIDGNREFIVKEWWWNKREDFDADRPREE